MSMDPQVFVPIEIRPGVIVPVYACASAPLGVVRQDGSQHLIAMQPIPAGTRLFRIEGVETRKATRYSVQVDAHSHIDMAPSGDDGLVLSKFFWRFLNHSCEPNTRIQFRDVIVLRDIQRGEDVTFNYNTTEYDMAEPFTCHCGAASCTGVIRGAKHLTAEQLERLRPTLAPYLTSLLASPIRSGSV